MRLSFHFLMPWGSTHLDLCIYRRVLGEFLASMLQPPSGHSREETVLYEVSSWPGLLVITVLTLTFCSRIILMSFGAWITSQFIFGTFFFGEIFIIYFTFSPFMKCCNPFSSRNIWVLRTTHFINSAQVNIYFFYFLLR